MRRPATRCIQSRPLRLSLTLWLLTTATIAPAFAEKDLTVKLPSAGNYQVWLLAETASGSQAQAPESVTSDRASLPLPAAPAGLKQWQVLVLDEKSGYVASHTLPAKDIPAEVSFTTPEFNRVHHVRVLVTGAGAKPVAGASVGLTDSKGNTLSRVIDASAAGTADFADVAAGSGKLTVTPTDGKSTTKEVDIDLPKGETIQQITVPLPEVTAVVEPSASAGPAATPGAADGKAGGGAPTGSAGTAAPALAPAPAPPAPAPSSSGWLGSLIGVLFVFGLLYVLYLYGRNQGWTADKALARLGVQPDSAVPAGPGPGASAPAPPPVDPNVCPFCGQRKDPVTGACACSLDALGGPASSAPAAAFASTGSGPRLVAVSGLAMGQIYPISGEATIGRDPGTTVPLAMDTTVSRRHAVIAPSDGGFVIRDQGSSNGTFVNGARVTEAPLRPGDELSIGGTRFRFEA